MSQEIDAIERWLALLFPIRCASRWSYRQFSAMRLDPSRFGLKCQRCRRKEEEENIGNSTVGDMTIAYSMQYGFMFDWGLSLHAG